MPPAAAGFTHLVADFSGVANEQLTDAALWTGLLIAAAGAAGFPTTGAPIARRIGGGGHSVVLFLDGCHMSVHALPSRGALLLDVLAEAHIDAKKALAVFTRKVRATGVRISEQSRG
jgi:S-adenosylmethionine/arginine decarboxylase-like enzyme